MIDVHPEADQDAIISALEHGAATGDGEPLRRIDTHMSSVFLSPSKVYKLKRARRHAFADFRELEARHRACLAELEVNRLFASALYESVEPVTRDANGTLRVGGEGEAIDWVVVMARFPDGALLSEMAESGGLRPDVVARAAERVAAVHASLPPHADAGRALDYRRIIDGLRRTEAEAAAELELKPGSDNLFEALERELARRSPLIEARRRAGWVRRGHGDLHLRNICQIGDEIVPFDALEFDPALATLDVLYDVAFLLMDLMSRGLNALANLAMNAYWDRSGQPQAGLALLPFFMSLRAAVRMAVAVEAQDLVEADRYRRLGCALLRPTGPRLVAIGGLSGSGKSTLAKALAPLLPGACGARVLRSDVLRKSLRDLPPAARLPAVAYGPEARAEVYRTLAACAAEALEAGASVVVDATFGDSKDRADIEEQAATVSFQGFWLRGRLPMRIARVAARRDDASDATIQVALSQVEPDDLGPLWSVLDADQSKNGLVEEVLDRLAPRAGVAPPEVQTPPAYPGRAN